MWIPRDSPRTVRMTSAATVRDSITIESKRRDGLHLPSYFRSIRFPYKLIESRNLVGADGMTIDGVSDRYTHACTMTVNYSPYGKVWHVANIQV